MSDRNHEAAGYGARTLGYGRKAAILVVDFQRAFTEPAFELGRFEHVHRAVERTAWLLREARKLQVPVIKCYTAYESAKDIPPWKVDAMYRDFFFGMPGTQPDPRLHDPDYDYTFSKTGASIFFQSPLAPYLVRQGVDTVIVTGCTTSGCVRASVVDAFSHGFRPIIPEDCAGDGSAESHRSNLLDLQRRYADISTAEAVIAQLATLQER